MIDIEVVWQGERHCFSLADGEHTVGRSSENAVHLPVTMVSKKHAALRVQGKQLWVRDLGSTNGTEVNGQPLDKEEVEVLPGRMVSFAGALMRRADSGPDAGASHLTMLTMTGQAQATLSYNSAQGFSDSGGGRILRLISGLFELMAMGKGRDEVEQAACKFVAEHIQADRVVLIGEKPGADTPLDIRARWTRGKDNPDAPLNLSSSIIRQVTQARESVLVSNPDENAQFARQQSIVALNLRSAMAAPLFDNERVRGILYVDTSQGGVRYEQADLEVLTATANAVAVKLRNIHLESELSTAGEIQRLMMPAQPRVEGYDIAARCVPARGVGGDFYDFITTPEGNFVLAVADVSGKGLPAALLMANVHATVRAQTAAGGSVKKRIDRANKLVHDTTSVESFVTLFYAELDAGRHELAYCNAGHEHPFLFRADGGVERLHTAGIPMGVAPNFEYKDGVTTLNPGDVLVVFSDGVTDSTNNALDCFGTERLERVVREHLSRGADAVAQAVIDAVEVHSQGDLQFDDLTMLVLRRL
jgi:sigma-B regulation protein RsbU (phosphoserine phosphatase)